MQLRAIAAGYFAGQAPNHTLQPTALVHEAILRLVRGNAWNSREHFLAVAATAMRQILVDHARGKSAQKRGGGAHDAQVGEHAPAAPAQELVDLDSAITTLARVDPRAAQVVTLRFFVGLTVQQAAQVMGVSDFTIERDWRAARAYLSRKLAGHAPGDGGQP